MSEKAFWLKDGQFISENNELILCDKCPCQKDPCLEISAPDYLVDVTLMGEFYCIYGNDSKQDWRVSNDYKSNFSVFQEIFQSKIGETEKKYSYGKKSPLIHVKSPSANILSTYFMSFEGFKQISRYPEKLSSITEWSYSQRTDDKPVCNGGQYKLKNVKLKKINDYFGIVFVQQSSIQFYRGDQLLSSWCTLQEINNTFSQQIDKYNFLSISANYGTSDNKDANLNVCSACAWNVYPKMICTNPDFSRQFYLAAPPIDPNFNYWYTIVHQDAWNFTISGYPNPSGKSDPNIFLNYETINMVAGTGYNSNFIDENCKFAVFGTATYSSYTESKSSKTTLLAYQTKIYPIKTNIIPDNIEIEDTAVYLEEYEGRYFKFKFSITKSEDNQFN